MARFEEGLGVTSDALLEVRGLSRSFGGVQALSDVGFTVAPGEIKAIIGPNGAGKTTLFNLICGLTRPDRGSIRLDGREIRSLPASARARLGLARTFQNLQVFDDMTVLENVMVGRHIRSGTEMLGALLRWGAATREEAAIRSSSLGILARIGLETLADRRAGSLSFGDRKLLEIARALATEPKLLLLDEPAAGLSHGAAIRALEIIRALNSEGLTVLLVEHNMPLVMAVAHSILVVDYGRPVADGPPEIVRRDPAVIAAYLGTGDDA